MTNGQELLENIEKRSISELEDLSNGQYQALLNATVRAIDKTLEIGESIDIEDFGVFSRRKQGDISVSFFQTADRLNERINRRK